MDIAVLGAVRYGPQVRLAPDVEPVDARQARHETLARLHHRRRDPPVALGAEKVHDRPSGGNGATRSRPRESGHGVQPGGPIAELVAPARLAGGIAVEDDRGPLGSVARLGAL